MQIRTKQLEKIASSLQEKYIQEQIRATRGVVRVQEQVSDNDGRQPLLVQMSKDPLVKNPSLSTNTEPGVHVHLTGSDLQDVTQGLDRLFRTLPGQEIIQVRNEEPAGIFDNTFAIRAGDAYLDLNSDTEAVCYGTHDNKLKLRPVIKPRAQLTDEDLRLVSGGHLYFIKHQETNSDGASVQWENRRSGIMRDPRQREQFITALRANLDRAREIQIEEARPKYQLESALKQLVETLQEASISGPEVHSLEKELGEVRQQNHKFATEQRE
ncbi:MAG: hypothetical protein O2962_01935 [Cyanobacteria bacterium]|nr:hypothetical protein [Cyanobacteriota bacterium]